MNIQTFREIITDHENKMKQIHIVLLCLNYVEEFPELASVIGCLWDSNSTFLINTSLFGSFINRKPNTINRGFRYHNFSRKMSSRKIRQNVPSKFNMNKLPDPTNWIQRSSKGFTKMTTEEEAMSWKYFDYKNPKPTVSTVSVEPSTIETDNLPNFENYEILPNIQEDLINNTVNEVNNNNNDDFSIIGYNHDDFFINFDEDNFNNNDFDDNGDIFWPNDGLY